MEDCLIRTRFAPSPTGYMHIGNLRTALFSYLIAKHNKGQFILRIEDTDSARNVPDAIQVIYDSLRLAGIEYDEGPNKESAVGPFIQSQRKEIYKHYIDVLLDQGDAFPCFCKKDENSGTHNECRTLSKKDVAARIANGEPHVVRQMIPHGGETSFNDHVYGLITVQNEALDDQVLIKSDGMPTYNFANVIDDHLMGITHVVRGMEYLSSTPKYNLLYKSFGWDIPEYVHLPHIDKEPGVKMAKRDGDASFQDLLAKGYLPEAIVNYIALLGWNPGDDREFFTLQDLIDIFDISRINKSNAIFTPQKLDWLNAEHIKRMSSEQFLMVSKTYFSQAITKSYDVAAISRLVHPRVIRLNDISEMVSFFIGIDGYNIRLYDFDKAKSTKESSVKVLKAVYPQLEKLSDWNNQALYDCLSQFAKASSLKTSTVMWPLRLSLSGRETTPGGATEIAEILGKTETLRRVSAAIELLENPDSSGGSVK
jgi:glutamyl-tRNA synthetase